MVPAYWKPQSVVDRGALHTWLGDFAGLSAKGGHVVVDHLHVPMKHGIDLNSPPGPLMLYFFAFLPTILHHDSKLEACISCKE